MTASTPRRSRDDLLADLLAPSTGPVVDEREPARDPWEDPEPAVYGDADAGTMSADHPDFDDVWSLFEASLPRAEGAPVDPVDESRPAAPVAALASEGIASAAGPHFAERSESEARRTLTVTSDLVTSDSDSDSEVVTSEQCVATAVEVGPQLLATIAVERSLTMPTWEQATTAEAVERVRSKDRRAAYMGAVSSHTLTVVNIALNRLFLDMTPDEQEQSTAEILGHPRFPTLDDLTWTCWQYLDAAKVLEAETAATQDGLPGLYAEGLDTAAAGIARRALRGWSPGIARRAAKGGRNSRRPEVRRFEHVETLPEIQDAMASHPSVHRRTLERDLARERRRREGLTR